MITGPAALPCVFRVRCLAEAYPGSTLAKIHSLSVQLLSEGLKDLGILPGASLDDIQRGLYRCATACARWIVVSPAAVSSLKTWDRQVLGQQFKFAGSRRGSRVLFLVQLQHRVVDILVSRRGLIMVMCVLLQGLLLPLSGSLLGPGCT